MATTVDDLLKQALQLPEGERARVAAELLASLDPDVDVRNEDAWIAEIERRAEAAIGGVAGLSWDETRRQVEARLSRNPK
jgi:putative addiction module component (TIGR02574 family)